MGQHSPIPPDDCASCVRVFERLRAHYEAGGGKLLAAVLSEDVGLGERALRVHLAYLAEHRRIEADRRTPVPGAAVAPSAPPLPEDAWPTPLDWAVTVECPDRKCRQMLLLYAREADASWEGQMGLAETAEALGCSVRTAQTHRAHLIEDGRLRTVADADVYPSGHPIRRPDRYQLLSSHESPTMGATWDEDQALDILAQVPWWPGAAPGETEKAVRRLIRHARNGWPAEALVRRTQFMPSKPVVSRIGLLRKVLPNLDAPFIVPAAEHLAQAREPVEMVLCPECGRPYPRAQRVRDGQLCRVCRPVDALPGVPIVTHGEPAF